MKFRKLTVLGFTLIESCGGSKRNLAHPTDNLHTKILDLRGFDSSIILSLRGGISRPTGNFPESLSQAILAGIKIVGRLGASHRRATELMQDALPVQRSQGGLTNQFNNYNLHVQV